MERFRRSQYTADSLIRDSVQLNLLYTICCIAYYKTMLRLKLLMHCSPANAASTLLEKSLNMVYVSEISKRLARC